MKLTNSAASIIPQKDPFKHIEVVGRTCYKSEDKITEDSAYKFVKGLIKRKHFAMLEHFNVTFKINLCNWLDDVKQFALSNRYVEFDEYTEPTSGMTGAYVTVSLSHLIREDISGRLVQNVLWNCFIEHYYPNRIGDCWVEDEDAQIFKTYVQIVDDVEKEFMNPSNIYLDHKFLTFHFICDRGVSHELVRHRCSFAQESTRYCNYSDDKFGGEIVFINPSNLASWEPEAIYTFMDSLNTAEKAYMKLINVYHMTPQQARAVLPNALKTEVIMTANLRQWEHFFDLRSKGTTGAPHPDMKKVADEAYELYKSVIPNYLRSPVSD